MDEKELPEAEPPRILDALTFHIQSCPLHYSDQKTLKEGMRAAIQNYLEVNGPQESARLLATSQDRGGIAPAAIFGAEFWPDMVLEAEGKPLAAILVKLVKDDPSGLAQAAGRALICSYCYPWVLVLVLDKGKRRRGRRELDQQFRADMWHRRHVRFVFL